MGGASSSILVHGLSWLYGLSGGEIELQEIVNGLINTQMYNSPGISIALISITVGIGFKLSPAPFHQWTPDGYEGVRSRARFKKGLRWIPRHPETRKGVASDEMLRGVENQPGHLGCRKVKEVGDLMTGEPATEAPVNGGSNSNGPKVAKFLVGMPSPIVTKKLKEKETSETEEGGERKEESDVETTSEMKETKQEQEGSTEENPSLCSEEREDLDKIDETEEIRVNGKEKTKDEFHFQEARYQDSPVYEDSDLETRIGKTERREKEMNEYE
ncbi:hypothetical protein M5K25_028352 [Dendrobium thyrsiflorum]|uniref:NADH:quinone oxidoreductase/Mrp antiporter transmembrane domain-containing protein n=1 Tax=Dendrobium thyrsiflorum TaxID=117978 RepID=A0ABD0TTH0_DENTH